MNTKEQIINMKKLEEQHKFKEKIIENITHGDVENIVNNYNLTLGEATRALSLMDVIKEVDKFKSNDVKWNTACAIAFAFKLGEMQGKREERSRRKDSKLVRGAM